MSVRDLSRYGSSWFGFPVALLLLFFQIRPMISMEFMRSMVFSIHFWQPTLILFPTVLMSAGLGILVGRRCTRYGWLYFLVLTLRDGLVWAILSTSITLTLFQYFIKVREFNIEHLVWPSVYCAIVMVPLCLLISVGLRFFAFIRGVPQTDGNGLDASSRPDQSERYWNRFVSLGIKQKTVLVALIVLVSASIGYFYEKDRVPSTDFSKIKIPFRDGTYSQFETVVTLRTAEDLKYFLKTIEDRNKGWGNKAIKEALLNENVDFDEYNIILLPITQGSGSIAVIDQTPKWEGPNILISINEKVPEVLTADMAYYGLAYKVQKDIPKVIFENTTIFDFGAADGEETRVRSEVQNDLFGSDSRCFKHTSDLNPSAVISKLEIPYIIPYEVRNGGQHTFIESDTGYHTVKPVIYLRSEEDLKHFLKTVEDQNDWKDKIAFKDAVMRTNLDFSQYDLILISKIAGFMNNNAPTESFSVEDISPEWEGQNIIIHTPKVTGKVWTTKTVSFVFAYKIKKGIPKIIIEDGGRYELQNNCS